MKSNFLVIILSLFVISGSVLAQTNKVDLLPFLLDGKDVTCEYKVTLFVKGKKITPLIESNSFEVPSEILQAKKIGLLLSCGSFQLSFSSLRPSDFVYKDSKYIWGVGIDRKPFEQVYVDQKNEDRIKEVQYIKFHPAGYLSTYLPVYIFYQKNRN